MISELANHLWQSTLFAVAVGLLTLMCRKNHASVRYWLWFSASVKFFIPFTLLMALGDRLEWASRAPQIAAPAVSATLAQVSRPFIEDPVTRSLFCSGSTSRFRLVCSCRPWRLGGWNHRDDRRPVPDVATDSGRRARKLVLGRSKSADACGHRRAIDSGCDGARRRWSLASGTAGAVWHRRRSDAAATCRRADARAVSHQTPRQRDRGRPHDRGGGVLVSPAGVVDRIAPC